MKSKNTENFTKESFTMSRKMLWGATLLPGCLVLATVWAILTLPGSALADPPPHNHGGGEAGQNIAVCIMFDDAPGDGVGSDDGTAYCDGDSNGKVTAIVARNFNIVLSGNNSHKKRAGRTFFLDLSVDLTCNGSVKVDVNRPSASGPFGDGGDVPAGRHGLRHRTSVREFTVCSLHILQ